MHLIEYIFSRLWYAVPAWSGFLAAEVKGHINVVLKHVFKYGFCSAVHATEALTITITIILLMNTTNVCKNKSSKHKSSSKHKRGTQKVNGNRKTTKTYGTYQTSTN